MERYYDEKAPLSSAYEVIEVNELPVEAHPKCKRPFWRRALRVILTVIVASMVWSTFAPVFRYSGGCSRHRTPSHDATPPDLDLDYLATLPTSGADDDFDKPKGPLLHYTFPSDISSFSVLQTGSHGVTRTKIIGNVIVHSCPKAANISTHFSFTATDDSLISDIEITPKRDSISFNVSPFSIAKQTINATVWVVIPKGKKYDLNHLRIGVTELDVWIKDTVTTPINTTYISTVSGHITSYGTVEDKNALDIEHLKITTVSGNIKGEFPLQHALALESTSGDIIANVSSAELPEETAWLKTGSVSGETKVKFVSGLHPRPLFSKHETVSGPLSVWYPEDWQGGFKVKTVSGKINVSGEGTKVVKKEQDIAGRFWKVIKGDGKSRGYFGSVSGDVTIQVGDINAEE